MKNLIMQSVNEIAQNPTVAKTVPIVAAGTGWATLEEWLPLVAGLIGVFMGAIASGVIVYINVAQHRIKMQLLKRDLADRNARVGRQDRRDD